MNTFDIIVTFTLLMSTVTGLYFGLLLDLATTLQFLVSILAVIYGTPHFLPAFQGILGDGLFATIVCVIFLYSAIFFPSNFIRHYFFRMVRVVILGIFDKPLGALTGFSRGILMITVGFMTYLWIWNPPMDAKFLQESKTLKRVEEYTLDVVSIMPDGLVNKTKTFVAMTSRKKDDVREKTKALHDVAGGAALVVSDPKQALEKASGAIKAKTQENIQNLEEKTDQLERKVDTQTKDFSDQVLGDKKDALIVRDHDE